MDGDNHKGRKGFSGLSDLATNLSESAELTKTKTEAAISGGESTGSSGKWIFGFVVIVGIAIAVFVGIPGEEEPSSSSFVPSQNYSTPPGSSAPPAETLRSAENTELRYVEPPVGTGNLLSVPQIRWCVREGIRIEAIRDVVDNHSEISRFNRKVTNYNNRCGNYSYYRGNLLRAERDVEPYRSQIIAKAIREATR